MRNVNGPHKTTALEHIVGPFTPEVETPVPQNLCVGKGSENSNVSMFIILLKFVNWMILDGNLDFLKAVANPGIKGF